MHFVWPTSLYSGVYVRLPGKYQKCCMLIGCTLVLPNCKNDDFLIEGFHVTSQQPNRASHAIHSRHVGSFFALSGIGESKIYSHSLLLNLHKAKLHRSNNVINVYSLTASLTCSNNISKKLKHILLFFPGISYTAPRKKISNMASARSAHGVRTAS